MKVACICNQNNNYFSLMRYLRDLGIEADLFIFKDESKHFLPENDTWEYGKWKTYIRTLKFGYASKDFYYTNREYIRRTFKEYDITIGSGPIPAYFDKAGLRLDIFKNYGTGIEYYNRKFSLRHFKRSLYDQYLKFFQIKGLKNTKICMSLDTQKATIKAYKKLKINLLRLSVPMVYNMENIDCVKLNEKLIDYINIFKSKDIVVFSHSKHSWKKTIYRRIRRRLKFQKNTDVLIEGFAKYVELKKFKNPLLVLSEYGSDVRYSKDLIKILDIEKYVFWLPLLTRKEIMILLKHIDIGAGQFGCGFWGGVGWEILSQGKPLLNYVNISNEEYYMLTNNPLPPILNVKKSEEIKSHLLNFEKNKIYYEDIGKQSLKWFNKYNGISLTKKYVYVAECIYRKLPIDKKKLLRI